MLDERMMDCARQASLTCGVPAEWIYSQWAHESTNVTPGSPFYGLPFKSDLAVEQNNFGGLTQEEENDTPQPDGNYFYMKFSSPEEYAAYFGRYIKKYFPTAAKASTIQEYVHLLKYGEDYVYYGDDEEVYLNGTLKVLTAEFPEYV